MFGIVAQIIKVKIILNAKIEINGNSCLGHQKLVTKTQKSNYGE